MRKQKGGMDGYGMDMTDGRIRQKLLCIFFSFLLSTMIKIC